MNDELIQLKLLAVSTKSLIREDVFAILLEEVNGKRRIPIVCGRAEAQAIALFHEKIKPPRPLTHDLLTFYLFKSGAEVKNVCIYKFELGIFYAQIKIVTSLGEEIVLDSRTSDAIAIAIRTGAPIYAKSQIVEEVGFDPDKFEVAEEDSNKSLQDASIEELRQILEECIENEEYERAQEIQQIIDSRKENE